MISTAGKGLKQNLIKYKYIIFTHLKLMKDEDLNNLTKLIKG